MMSAQKARPKQISVAASADVDVVALDNALIRLAQLDPQQERIIELRFFTGLSIKETAEALNNWITARAWLYRELTRAGSPPV